jgi:hypothetical protein
MRIAVRAEARQSDDTGSATATLAPNVPYLLSRRSSVMHTRRVANVVAICFGLAAAIAAVLMFASG